MMRLYRRRLRELTPGCVRVCVACGETRRHEARGLCKVCYHAQYRAAMAGVVVGPDALRPELRALLDVHRIWAKALHR